MSHKSVSLSNLKSDLQALAYPEKAKLLARYFKTGKGQYGEGDKFLGIMVPNQRKIAKKYAALPLGSIRKLLASRIHEHRLVALLILVGKYKTSDSRSKKAITDFYLRHTRHVNNWDLVDLSAPRILGDYLIDKDRTILYRLAVSESIWERRIAILSTFSFIRNNDFSDSLNIAELLLPDNHDLIQKACGWMLREIGKKDPGVERGFLLDHHRSMPRTMIRYAIERFDGPERRFFLNRQ